MSEEKIVQPEVITKVTRLKPRINKDKVIQATASSLIIWIGIGFALLGIKTILLFWPVILPTVLLAILYYAFGDKK